MRNRAGWLAAVIALAGLTVVYRRTSRRLELVAEDARRAAEAAATPPAPAPRNRGVGWWLVLLTCTSVVAAGALALALRTAFLDDVAPTASARAASPELPAPGLQIATIGFGPGELRLRVTNPHDFVSRIGLVTVDDAIVAFHLDGASAVAPNESRTVVVPYDWVTGTRLSVAVTTAGGVESSADAQAPAVDQQTSPGQTQTATSA